MIRYITDSSKEPEKVVCLCIDVDDDGRAFLTVRGENGANIATLLIFHTDGSMRKVGSVRPDIGLKLDNDGCIDIC